MDFSVEDVINTLRALKNGSKGYRIKDDRLEGAYIFVSELTGMSVDRIGEAVLDGEE